MKNPRWVVLYLTASLAACAAPPQRWKKPADFEKFSFGVASAAGATGALRAPKPLTLKLHEIKPMLFTAQFEIFHDSGPATWGRGKVLGGLWRYDLPSGTELRGATLAPGPRILVVEKPESARLILRQLDISGHSVSSGPFSGFVDGLDYGRLGDRNVLMVSSMYRLDVLDMDQETRWEPEHTIVEYVLADLDGDGRNELVALDSGYRGTATAFDASGKKLWTRKNLGHTRSLAAGRLADEKADSIVVFASDTDRSIVSLLNGKGKVVLSTSDASRPELGAIADLGGGPRLVSLGSYFQSRRERLKIWRIGLKKWEVEAEADLGWTHVKRIVLADLDGDGVKEIVLGTENGWVLVFSARAEFLAERHFFGEIGYLSAGDINGDGIDDILIGVKGLAPIVYAAGVVPDPRPAPPAKEE